MHVIHVPGRRSVDRRRACCALLCAAVLCAGFGSTSASAADVAGIRIRVEPDVTEHEAGSVALESSDEPTEVGERDIANPAGQVPNGDTIVAVAMPYLGYPYLWAGNTPAGFDCAGFAQFIVAAATGIDIGHGLGGQPASGSWVEWGAWQPGDLVFFQNTYQAGLSHVGIYIGDGLFIHAENEGTGVIVSSMYSDYYGPRYWGAVSVV